MTNDTKAAGLQPIKREVILEALKSSADSHHELVLGPWIGTAAWLVRADRVENAEALAAWAAWEGRRVREQESWSVVRETIERVLGQMELPGAVAVSRGAMCWGDRSDESPSSFRLWHAESLDAPLRVHGAYDELLPSAVIAVPLIHEENMITVGGVLVSVDRTVIVCSLRDRRGNTPWVATRIYKGKEA